MTPIKTSSQKGKKSVNEVIAAFVACPRCSYFFISYRLLHEDFDSAVSESVEGWLLLSWDRDVNLLVQKSFGSPLYMDLDSYQGICRECQRPFSYKKIDPDTDKTSFKVKIVP